MRITFVKRWSDYAVGETGDVPDQIAVKLLKEDIARREQPETAALSRTQRAASRKRRKKPSPKPRRPRP